MREKREMPEGFAEDAGRLGHVALKEKYGASDLQVARWRRELGGVHKNRFLCPVAQIDMETGERIAVYPSQAAAAKAVYGLSANINSALRGRTPHAYGWRWEYAEEAGT